LAAIRREIGRVRQSRRDDAESVWFRDHFYGAASEIIAFLEGVGVSLHGLRVADVGCGDGIMALGFASRAKPAELVGFDLNRTEPEALLARARAQGVATTLPENLRFEQCTPDHLPAPDGSFDVVYTWSAFEHVEDSTAVLSEINRILKPDGLLFLQLWPFYLSERGSHLWKWFPQSFHHLLTSEEQIEATMTSGEDAGDFMTAYMLEEYKKLNRITLGELQDALLAAEFDVVRLDLLTHLVPLAPELARRFRLSDLGIGGVKLLARPRLASVAREPAVPSEVSEPEKGPQE
jgi:ubiquinone/menaquinone biosynthesis C-methylase UbiE